MQHSLFRDKGETVKLFSHKDPSKVRKTLQVFVYTERGFEEISQSYLITDLNIGYYSTEIVTPDENCYLLILFCGNPIILRVGSPKLQFMYHSTNYDKDFTYHHFDEFGILKAQGFLNRLGSGFYFYTPIEETLGYIEVNGRSYVLNIPYNIKTAGIGINVDWRRTIIRQTFGVKTTQLNFKLNNVIKREFAVDTVKHTFEVKTRENKFNLKTIKQKFKVFCK